MLAVVVTVVAAFAGLQPSGARQVAGTRLMGVARTVLVLVVLIGIYLAFHNGAFP
jgi:hypothetical protein